MYIFPIFEIGDLRSCLKSRIGTDVHVNYDDTELENKGKYLDSTIITQLIINGY